MYKYISLPLVVSRNLIRAYFWALLIIINLYWLCCIKCTFEALLVALEKSTH